MKYLRLIFFIGFAFYTFLGFAQNEENIRLLKQQVKGATGDLRFNLLNDLAWEYRFAYPDSCIYYAQNAFTYGKSIQINAGLARSLNIIGIATNYAGDIPKAYIFYSDALELALQQKDSAQIAYTNNNLGRISQQRGRLSKAFEHFTEAIKIFEIIGDSAGLAYGYQSFGNLYQAQRNYSRAGDYFLKGLTIRLKQKNQRNIHSAYYMVGRMYADCARVDESQKYLNKADSVGRNINDEIQLAETWIYIAKNLLSKNQIQEADSIVDVSLQVIRKKKSIRILSQALLIKAQIEEAKKSYGVAKQLLDEALKNALKVSDLTTRMDVYFELWKVHEKMNNRPEALFNQNQYLLINDTLKNLDISNLEENLKFEATILQREKENEILKSQNLAVAQKQKFQWILFGAISLFVLCLGYIQWRFSRKTKLINKQLVERNELLHVLNNEKDTLMNIVVHDLKAPLNRISGLTSLLENEKENRAEQLQYLSLMKGSTLSALDMITDLLDVNSLEQVNDSPTMSRINLKELLETRVNLAGQAARAKQISLTIITEVIEVFSNENYLNRILDNLLSNAIKFSNAGTEITLRAEVQHDHFWFSVKDHGQGFSEEDNKFLFQKFRKLSARPTAGESSNGLGLAIVKTLVDKLHGKIELKSEPAKGSEFIISLPMNTTNKGVPKSRAAVL
ncbi:MAG TPA: tetratricopeptide repeat-containing sensor histidine kinase [Cyclobacteriaceae bacterium]|nr:tetratricopeptide repeat-containing sensor histidine kinase [Cyclobacteriaceae bacterium]